MEKHKIRVFFKGWTDRVANGLDMNKWKHAFGCEGGGVRDPRL